MNVLEIHGSIAKFGGASNGTKILIEELSKMGIDVYLCANYKNEVLKRGIKNNCLFLNLSTKNVFRFVINIIKINDFIKKKKIDIIHSHHRNDTIYATILKVFNRNIKIIYTVHGLQTVKNETAFYKLLQTIFLFLVNKNADSIVYISQFTMDKLEEKYNKIKQQTVILNGSRLPIVKNNKLIIRREINVKNNSFIISIIGGIGGVKRPKIVLKLAELLKEESNLYFVFIGEGSEKKEIIELIEKKNLENIRFVNTTPDIGSYINASDIIISTAYEEGFGRTLVEAMALKKPIISFNIGGPKEIIVNNYNGYLIDEGDIKAYADKINFLNINRDIAKKMGENGYNLFLEKFSQENYVNGYLKEFEKLID